jgi:hypothetical protein
MPLKKDLGDATAMIAERMSAINPDSSRQNIRYRIGEVTLSNRRVV